jgi:hypothetical protein
MSNLPISISPDIIEKLVIKGDLSGLNQAEKVSYYNMICNRVGVDPAMQPFKLLNLQGKQVLYLDRSGAQQLNKIHQVSHAITAREIVEAAGVYVVTARASLPDGRYTDSLGAVNISGLKGDAYGNAMMKAETKAKRRATLDLLGLGMMDETETETIPGAAPEPLPVIPIQASITDEINGIPKPYLMPQSDAQYICDLIEQATTTASLRSLMSTNVAFFQSNVEVKNRLLDKGMKLKKIETESITK